MPQPPQESLPTSGPAQATAPATAPVTLETAARIPLHVDRDGSVTYPQVEIDETAGIVYVNQAVGDSGFVSALVWYAPDLSLLAMVMVVTLTVRHAWRVLTRPQRPGARHCRHCNHELTSHSPCPECGKGAPRPVIGRTAIERLVGPLILAAVLCAACAGIMVLTLQKPAWPAGRLWPAPVVSEMVPALKLQKKVLDRGNEHIITRYRLPASGTLTTAPLPAIGKPWRFDDEFHYGTALSPDGAYFVASVGSWTTGDQHSSLLVIDTRTGKRVDHRTASGGMAGFAPSLRGFTPDGRCVYIQLQSRGNFGATTCTNTLSRIDLATGAKTEIVAVTSPLVNEPSGPSVPQQFFVVRDNPQKLHGVSWAMYSHTSPSRAGGAVTQTGELVVPEGNAERRIPLSFSGSSFYAPVFAEEGRAIHMDLYGTPSPTTLTIDIATGDFAEVPANHNIGMPASRAGGLSFAQPIPGSFVPGATVIDDATRAPLAFLREAPIGASMQFTPTAKWACTTAITAPTPAWWTNFGIGGNTRAEVLVWDTSSVRPLPPSPGK